MKEIDYIKRDIKALKKHLKNSIRDNTLYLIPVIKNQLERLKQTKFNLEKDIQRKIEFDKFDKWFCGKEKYNDN